MGSLEPDLQTLAQRIRSLNRVARSRANRARRDADAVAAAYEDGLAAAYADAGRRFVAVLREAGIAPNDRRDSRSG